MRKYAVLHTLIALSLVLAACAGKPAGAPAAILQDVEEGVQISLTAGAAFTPAGSGQELPAGGSVQTGPSGKARLLIQPGHTLVSIGADTLFTLAELKPASARLQLERGNVWIAPGEASLAVETAAGIASVSAGEMGVGLAGGTASVACLKGRCEVTMKGKTSSLGSGQACDLDPGGSGCQARDLTQAESLAWAADVTGAEPALTAGATVEVLPSLTPALTLADTLPPTLVPTSTETPALAATPPPPATARLQPPVAADITVDGTWGHITRTSGIAALYMVIHNNGASADALVGAASPSCGSTGMQIMGIGPDGNDLALYVGLPAGAAVSLQFQGTRILCYNVAGGIGPGSSVQLTLHFQNSGDLTVTIPIQNPPEG